MLKHLFTKRALTALLLTFAMTFSLAGCGSGSSSQSAPSAGSSPQSIASATGGSTGDGDFTVAISLNSLDEYQTMMTQCLEEELAKLGGTLFRRICSEKATTANLNSRG